MSDRYYMIYQTDFDRYAIEITYPYYEYCMHMERNLNLTLDGTDLTNLTDMLDSLGFEDRTEEEEI